MDKTIIYVCGRIREGNVKPSCGNRGSLELIELFKTELEKQGISDVDVDESRCLGACQDGPTVIIFPENVWYGGVKPENVPEIVTSHIRGKEPVQRLRLVTSLKNIRPVHIELGHPVPGVTLENASGEQVAISKYLGKKNVLLYFYPMDFVPTCTKQHCKFSVDLAMFERYDTVVLSISTDSRYCHQAFKEKFSLRQELLSDVHRKVTKDFGVLLESINCSKCAYFFVDKSGILRWKKVMENIDEPLSVQEILSVVKTIVDV